MIPKATDPVPKIPKLLELIAPPSYPNLRIEDAQTISSPC